MAMGCIPVIHKTYAELFAPPTPTLQKQPLFMKLNMKWMIV
jgi:hypothetical protein